jgi:hypothetical protein
MIRNFGLAVVFASIALPSLAAQRCEQPYAPEIPIAANTTKEQITILRDDVRTFLAASDVYQACLSKAAQAGTSSLRDATNLIAANQKEKERIGHVFNALLGSYRQTNVQASDSGNLELVSR